MKNHFYSAIAALQFLTRIPIRKQVPFTPEVLKLSTIWFPLAGAAIGLCIWLAGVGLQLILPAYPAAALLVFFAVVLSGGLHMDGLMDTADGLLSNRDRDRVIEIMKDSRVGAMGVLACVLVLLLQWSFIGALLEMESWSPLVVLPFIISRYVMVWAIVVYPHTEAESGLGRYFMGTNRKHLLVSGIVMLVLIGLCMLGTAMIASIGSYEPPSILAISSHDFWLWGIFGGIVLIILQLVVTHWIACVVKRRIGGLSGDIYGAMGELTVSIGLMLLVIGVKWLANLYSLMQ
ncbi:adenosylcobinamide-GDP ribazoletransferase [Paenibacillus sp. SC116]|uniref:adenosylcobinamide-GDP ribazoletransferase n=1 Tax=Paenibacillus sp. SC116 TaxID=2968986 RepID=UPI00215A26F5|nr:adenosylcobinamide-GDP ribazoletransferase [Paenibacillus sp. SC116]MCR8843971.1 adenosylcobinamide-GDP ribazoletransferase [Paenibacillus sp. SC116]